MTTTPILAITEVAPNQDQKETTINDGFVKIEGSANDRLALTFTGNARTLNATEYTSYNVFSTGTIGTTGTITVPLTKRRFSIFNVNATASVLVKGATGNIGTVAAGAFTDLYCDGTNVTAITSAAGTAIANFIVSASPFLNAGTINASGQTITAATLAASSLIGNSGTAGAIPAAISLDTSLSLNGGSLAVTGTKFPYTVGIFTPGTMSNSQTLGLHQVPGQVVFPSNFGASSLGGSSKAGSGVNATGSTTILISQCAAASDPTSGGSFSNVGTIVIGAGGHAGTLTSSGAVTLAAGDFLRIMGPGTADATLSNFFATLVGNR